MGNLVCTIMMILSLAANPAQGIPEEFNINTIPEEFGNYRIVESQDFLSCGEFDGITIEKCYGVVLNADCDGIVVNATDTDYNYISYRGVRGAVEGAFIGTYFIYLPGAEEPTDRIDYVLDTIGVEDFIGDEYVTE